MGTVWNDGPCLKWNKTELYRLKVTKALLLKSVGSDVITETLNPNNGVLYYIENKKEFYSDALHLQIMF